MATPIGTVKALIGTVTATAADGSQRTLQLGDIVYADEMITTGAAGAVEIEFADGSVIDLGRSSQALLDNDVFDPQQTAEAEAETDVDALQQALLDGEDPSQISDPTAAGAESEDNQGTTTVVVEHLAPIGEVSGGFETNDPAAVITAATTEELLLNPELPSPLLDAVDDNITINEDAPVVNSSVRGNDLLGEAPSSFALTTNVTNGTLVFRADGSYSYTPNPDFNGTDSFTYTLTDSDGQTDTATVTINVGEADDDTITNPDSNSTNEDTTLTVVAINGVLSNDSDVDDTLTVASFTVDANGDGSQQTFTAGATAMIAGVGSLAINSDGGYSFVPVANYNGPVPAATYITNTGASETLSLNVTPVNDPPVIDSAASDLSGLRFDGLNGGYYGVNYQLSNITQVRGIVDANDPGATFRATQLDYGPGGGSLGQDENLQSFLGSDAATLSADPESATDVALHLTGQVFLEAGTYQFRVTGDDGYQIRINGNSVAEINHNQSSTTTTHAEFTIDSPGFYDVDIIYWEQAGEYVFQVELGQGGTFQAFSSFEFRSDAPSSVIEAGTTDSGVAVAGIDTATGQIFATDIDSTVLTWSGDSDSALGMFVIDPITGVWTYTLDNVAADFLAEGDIVTEVFTVTVTDESGATDSVDVTITIQGANDVTTSAPLIVADDPPIAILIAAEETLFATEDADILTGSAGADNFIWTKATVDADNADQVVNFNSSNDTLDLSDLLADGSHTIVGLESSGHLQVQVNDAGGQLVQTIDLNNIAVGTDSAAASLLNDLVTNGTIDDGM